MENRGMGHGFSVEMKSKRHVKRIMLSDGTHEGVLFEGFLGEIKEIGMVEEAVLEIKGTNGTLRIDLSEEELRRMLSPKKEVY
jgi:hypothetical protein